MGQMAENHEDHVEIQNPSGIPNISGKILSKTLGRMGRMMGHTVGRNPAPFKDV